MNVQRFCPHCGEQIAADPEQKFCMFCGESVSDAMMAPSEIIYSSDSDESTHKIQWWQLISGGLFFLLGMSSLLSLFYDMFSTETFLHIIKIQKFLPLVWVIALALLFLGARNKAVVIGLSVFIVSNLAQEICYLFFLQYAAVFTYMFVVIAILNVYVYSLILQNCEMSAKSRVWINLLIVFCSLTIFWRTVPLWQTEDFAISYIEKFSFVLMPMQSIALWQFACSEVFSGPYDKDAKCNLSPLNRGMAVLLIVPALIAMSLFVLSKFSDVFPN